METIIGAVIGATAAWGVVGLTRRGERAAWLRQERLAAYSDVLSHFLRSDPARVITSAAAAEVSEEDAAASVLTAEQELPPAEDELRQTEQKLQQVEHRLQQAEEELQHTEHELQQVTGGVEFQTHALELFARIRILGPPDMSRAAVRLITAHRGQGIPSEKARSSLNDAEEHFILTANYVIGEAGWRKRLRPKM